MRWFRSQKDATIQQLVAQLSDTQLELSLEREKRVAAENLAIALRERAERAEEYYVRAEQARNEAIQKYTDSLAATADRLLDHKISPEGPTPDIKSFSAAREVRLQQLGSTSKRVPAVRRHFKDQQINAMKPRITPPIIVPKLNADGKPTLGLREGLEALNLDDLIQ